MTGDGRRGAGRRRPGRSRARLAAGLLATLAAAALAGPGRAQTPPSIFADDTAARASPLLPAVARLQYAGGGDWYANPSSLPNLLEAVRTRTGIRVAAEPARVRITDPDLPDHPYLYVTGHGNIRLSEEELETLRSYLRAGGFLHVDDNYGLDASFRREVARLFPDRELVDVPLDHPIYRIPYELGGLPKVHEHDGLPARGLGIFLDGRLVLFYSYQSDLGDGWEDPQVHGDPAEVRERALRMGVNLFVYALASGGAGA